MKTPSKFTLWMLSLHLVFLLSFCKAQHQTPLSGEWLILGPFPVQEGEGKEVSEEKQKEAFKTDHLNPLELTHLEPGRVETINGNKHIWKKGDEVDHVVDLDKLFDSVDYVSAYAWAEFEVPESRKVLLGVGSDDGVKVWLNGELVHENWVPRGISLDDDLIPVTLRKGSNQLLVKVQDMQYAWSFSCRILPPEAFAEKLAEAAGSGQVDEIDLLLTYGADINAKNELGLTAIHAAKINGRKDVAAVLLKKGANPDIPMPAKTELADAYLKNLVGEHQPGTSVLVARNGEILYKNGFGFANLEKNELVTPETEFRIGSITKQFTATAILKLVEEGKLSLDDKLSKFIPDYPRGDEVTIHHLLTHTSGIKSYTDKINFTSKEVTLPIASIEQHIESFKNDPYNFDPGESFSYNNSGYFLLGYIVEKVSGKPYEKYLKQQFFKPFKMKHTGVHYGGIKLKHEAIGYSYQNGKAEIAPNWEMTWAGGAGALYSTVDDLFKWNEAIFNNQVLTETSLKAAFTPVKLNNGQDAQLRYGYGWIMGGFRGWEDISHGGGLPGFVTFLTRFPEQNITVTVLTNAMPQNRINPPEVSYELAEIFFWEEMEEQTSYMTDENADTNKYPEYAGRYEYPGGAVLMVTVEGDKLFAQLTGQPKFEIFPQDSEKFFWKVVDAQVRFVRNDEGQIIHAVHTQGGRTFEAPKLEDEPVAVIDPSILVGYVGTYDLNGSDVAVTFEGEQLYVQVSGQPRFEIYPRSAKEFFLKAVKADLTFVENETGQVEKIILNQGGIQYNIPKKK